MHTFNETTLEKLLHILPPPVTLRKAHLYARRVFVCVLCGDSFVCLFFINEMYDDALV